MDDIKNLYMVFLKIGMFSNKILDEKYVNDHKGYHIHNEHINVVIKLFEFCKSSIGFLQNYIFHQTDLKRYSCVSSS